MSRINVLDKHVAELIAAGEVVERPSSVIKELVENSIDAGSTVITVEIKRGGITMMRVTDNGCGIEKDDVVIAFRRHATSKVIRPDDLDSIGTLGFRGEALASISAVSHTEIITRTGDSEIGTRAALSGGDVQEITDAGSPKGTTIIVRDLFFNTPARMKFLKKDISEGNAVAKILDKIALSHPEVSFRFIRDGKEVLHTPGDNNLKSAIYAVFGKAFTSELIPVEYEHNRIKVNGFISTPHGARPNRNMENFFINGRCVRSKTAIAAIEEAYKGSILVGKFPGCVLHIEMNCSDVDVNVHPAKLEIRFANEKPIFDAVYYAVKSALTRGEKPAEIRLTKTPVSPYISNEKAEQVNLETIKSRQDKVYIPAKTMVKPFDSKPIDKPVIVNTSSKLADKVRNSVFFDSGIKEPFTYNSDKVHTRIEDIMDSQVYPIKDTSGIVAEEEIAAASQPQFIENTVHKDSFISYEEPTLVPKADVVQTPVHKEEIESVQESQVTENIRFIGEAFSTYIILQYGKDKLLIIDKHAAHERLLYEKLKKQKTGSEAQTLLAPVPVVLDKDEYTAVLLNADKFAEAGFDIDDFGDGTVLIRSAPLSLDGQDATEAVIEIAGYLCNNKNSMTTEYMDWMYHNIACRAAIKGGNKSSDKELIELAKELQRNPDVKHCPHGRPITLVITKRELEKQFGRIQ